MSPTPVPNGRARDHATFALLWAAYAVLVRHFWFIADDAYISFRFSRNWGSGNGLRYNMGDHPPEEGFSNFLMVAIGATVEKLGLSIEFWLPVVAFLSGSALLYLVFRLARYRFDASLPVAAIATAALGFAAQFAVWSTSGLETMTYALLLFATFERLILRRDGIDGVGAGVLAVLVALSRVEGVYWALALVPMAAMSRRARQQSVARPLLIYAAVLAVGYGGWFLWKYEYFGHAFAATVHSKVAFSGERLMRGFQYVTTQYLTSLSLFVLLPGLFVASRPVRRAYALPVAMMPIGFAAFAMLVSGDFMTFGRFLLPALPFNALLLTWILHDLWALGRRGRLTGATLGMGCIVLGVLPGWNVHLVPRSLFEANHFRRRIPTFKTEYEQWQMMRGNAIRWAVRGRALRAISKPGDSVVLAAIGATGFESDLFVFDRHGFVTPLIAMRESKQAKKKLRSPGHDQPVTDFHFLRLGHKPTFIHPKLIYEDDRDGLILKLDLWKRKMKNELGTDQPYGFDFYRVPYADEQGQAYLMIWRRIPAQKRRRAAEQRLEDKLDAARAGGEVEDIDMPPQENRVAGLPSWL